MLTGRDQRAVRRDNLSVLLRLVERDGPVSRRELARLSGLTPASVSQIVGELVARGVLAEVGSAPAGGDRGGRRRRLLDLAAGGVHAVGLHFGINEIELAIVDGRGRMIARTSFFRRDRAPIEGLLERTARAVEALLAERGVPRGRIVGVGMGVVGVADRVAGHGLAPFGASNPGHQPFRLALEARLGLPVVADDHVRAMAQAEAWLGSGREERDLVLVWVGSTLGLATVSAGQVQEGAAVRAGQFGHVTAVPGGEPCDCGRRGCLDTVASGRALARLARARGWQSVVTFDQFLAAAQRDPALAETLIEAGRHLGRAIADVVWLLDPGMVVLAGLVNRVPEPVLRAIRETVAAETRNARPVPVRLELTGLGRDLAVVGAASLALQAFYADPAAFFHGDTFAAEASSERAAPAV